MIALILLASICEAISLIDMFITMQYCFIKGPFYLCPAFIPISFLPNLPAKHKNPTDSSAKCWNDNPICWEYWFETPKDQLRSCLSALAASWSGVHFLVPYTPVSSISNENNNVHLTHSYECWLRKHLWTYSLHCYGHTKELDCSFFFIFTVPLKLGRLDILSKDTEINWTVQ